METEGQLRVMDVFVGIRDPRQAKKVEHALVELLVISVCGVLAGAEILSRLRNGRRRSTTGSSGTAIGMIESEQEIKGKVSVDRRYFIVSAGAKTVEQFTHAVRAHWGVEAMHWVLNVTFREDDCRVRKGHAARNLSAIRKYALSALRTDTQHPSKACAAAENSPTDVQNIALNCSEFKRLNEFGSPS